MIQALKNYLEPSLVEKQSATGPLNVTTVMMRLTSLMYSNNSSSRITACLLHSWHCVSTILNFPDQQTDCTLSGDLSIQG